VLLLAPAWANALGAPLTHREATRLTIHRGPAALASVDPVAHSPSCRGLASSAINHRFDTREQFRKALAKCFQQRVHFAACNPAKYRNLAKFHEPANCLLQKRETNPLPVTLWQNVQRVERWHFGGMDSIESQSHRPDDAGILFGNESLIALDNPFPP
jgi:hypothetical protein